MDAAADAPSEDGGRPERAERGRGDVTRIAGPRARRIADLLWVLRKAGGTRLVFLHAEYDRAWPYLRRVAGAYRRHALGRTCLVAVSGSAGKTTTKRTLDAVLDVADRRHSRSNYESSLAENLLRTRPWDRHAVVEIGLSGPGQMDGYARMLAPDIAVVTAITSEHYPAFRTLEHTRAEKAKLLAALAPAGLAVLNGDDPHVRWMASQTRARVRTFGLDPANDVHATEVRLDWPRGMSFTLRAEGASCPVRLPLLGRHMVRPALAAAAVGLSRGLALPAIAARLAGLTPAPGRMEVVRLPSGAWMVDDSVKGPVETVHAALDMLAELPARRRIVVLGPVQDSPGSQEAVLRHLGTRIAEAAQRLVLLVPSGAASDALRQGALEGGMHPAAIGHAGPRIDSVIRLLRAELAAGDVVLLKGAGVARLERVRLALAGRDVRCQVRTCRVKVQSCADCPLLPLDTGLFQNHFVRRYFAEP